VRAKNLFHQTLSADTNIAQRNMNDRIIDEIAQTVYDIKRPWSNVTMRKYDKDEEPFA